MSVEQSIPLLATIWGQDCYCLFLVLASDLYAPNVSNFPPSCKILKVDHNFAHVLGPWPSVLATNVVGCGREGYFPCLLGSLAPENPNFCINFPKDTWGGMKHLFALNIFKACHAICACGWIFLTHVILVHFWMPILEDSGTKNIKGNVILILGDFLGILIVSWWSFSPEQKHVRCVYGDYFFFVDQFDFSLSYYCLVLYYLDN